MYISLGSFLHVNIGLHASLNIISLSTIYPNWVKHVTGFIGSKPKFISTIYNCVKNVPGLLALLIRMILIARCQVLISD